MRVEFTTLQSNPREDGPSATQSSTQRCMTMDVRSELRATVQALVQVGKGILAADESGPTIAKR